MQHIMLDLETMGTGPNAAIVAIGAVEFDLNELTTGRTFYTAIDLVSAVESGGTIDASTVLWWLKQDETARAELTDGEKMNHQAALWRFASYLKTIVDAKYIWGNGSDFDNVILSNAYKRAAMPPQWRWSLPGNWSGCPRMLSRPLVMCSTNFTVPWS